MTQSCTGPLAAAEGELAAPAWFSDACAHEPTERTVDVRGCAIHQLVWEPSTAALEEPLVLLHGTAAHAHWWSHVAPLLARDRRVVAVDLSGHGDSGWRTGYGVDLWADEVLAVLPQADPDRRGVSFVGHSLGGVVASVAAARDEWPIVGVAQCESVRDPRADHPEDMPNAPRRFYETAHEAVARFRPVPAQPNRLPYVERWIAERSVTRHHEGWSWKFDPSLVPGLRATVPTATELAAQLRSPFAVLHAEHGFVTREDADAVAAAGPTGSVALELPHAGHHPMLDEPLSLVVAIRFLLTTWSTRSRGARR